MVSAQGPGAGRDLYRATIARGFGFYGPFKSPLTTHKLKGMWRIHFKQGGICIVPHLETSPMPVEAYARHSGRGLYRATLTVSRGFR
jgi:hypothetical protein